MNPTIAPRTRTWIGLRTAAAIFLLAFLVRVGLLAATRAYNQPLRIEIHLLAMSIASGRGYANPYPTPTGPTALYTPGCPLLLAGIYRLCGTGRAAEASTYLLNAAFVSLVFALMPSLAVRLGLPRRTGLIAAVAGALFPVYLLNEFRSITAVTSTLCLVLLTFLALALRCRPLTARLGLAVGLAWGVALLFAPNLLLIGVLWLAVLVVRRCPIAFPACAVVAVCAVFSPWIVRNQIVLHAPILTRSNLGLELWIANNDLAAASYGDNTRSQFLYQPFVNTAEAAQIRALGEPVYMRLKLVAAEAWIAHHPARFLALTSDRVFHFWLPVAFRPLQTLVLRTLTFAALAGLGLAWFRSRNSFWIVASLWLVYPLVYYCVQLDNPYRYPLYWSVLLLASYAVLSVADLLFARVAHLSSVVPLATTANSPGSSL